MRTDMVAGDDVVTVTALPTPLGLNTMSAEEVM